MCTIVSLSNGKVTVPLIRDGLVAPTTTPRGNQAGFCVNNFSHTADSRKFVFARSSGSLVVYAAQLNRSMFKAHRPFQAASCPSCDGIENELNSQRFKEG
jgi:hypothetical protein